MSDGSDRFSVVFGYILLPHTNTVAPRTQVVVSALVLFDPKTGCYNTSPSLVQ